MLQTQTFDVLTVVREMDADRNELRFAFSSVFEAMAERARTDKDGNVDEDGIVQDGIDTLREVCVMLTRYATAPKQNSTTWPERVAAMVDAETVEVDVALPQLGDPTAWVVLTKQPDGDGAVVAVALRRRVRRR